MFIFDIFRFIISIVCNYLLCYNKSVKVFQNSIREKNYEFEKYYS